MRGILTVSTFCFEFGDTQDILFLKSFRHPKYGNLEQNKIDNYSDFSIIPKLVAAFSESLLAAQK